MPALKVLLDECIDKRFAREIPQYIVKTVPEMGWAALKDGELLVKAQREFEVFITLDRNLSFQQNLPEFGISVLVLCAKSNRLQDLLPLSHSIAEALNDPQPGKAIFIDR